MAEQIFQWRNALTPDERSEVARADVLADHHGTEYHAAVSIREAIRKRATRRLRYAALRERK